MAKEVIMPALGMAQETGILLEWLKAEGESVTKGEPLMAVETDKATMEVDAPISGTLVNITAQPGDEIPVGQPIALILAEGEAAPPADRTIDSPVALQQKTTLSERSQGTNRDEISHSASPVATRIAAEHKIDLAQINATGDRIRKDDVLAYIDTQKSANAGDFYGRVLASPKARRLAQERGIELASLNGSGPEGAVLAADVLNVDALNVEVETTTSRGLSVATAPQSKTSGAEILTTSRMWNVMSQRLTESWQTIPHFYLEREVNASQLLSWSQSIKERTSQKITLSDLLVKIVAVALRKHPRVNAAWQNDNILLQESVNVGLAVAVEEGLLVPVIHNADELSITTLANQRRELVERAREGNARSQDLLGGTFTISNLGMFGVDSFHAIVNPPQAAILGIGRVVDRVVPVEGAPAIQPMVTLTLSCDHRIVDGAIGAQFLQTVVQGIEEPLSLLD